MCDPLTLSPFLGLCQSPNFLKEALRFGSRLCLFLEAKIAPSLVDPLHSAILSDWARWWNQSQLPKRGAKNYARDKSKKSSLCQCTELHLYFPTHLEQLGTKSERRNWHLVAAVASFANRFQLPFLCHRKIKLNTRYRPIYVVLKYWLIGRLFMHFVIYVAEVHVIVNNWLIGSLFIYFVVYILQVWCRAFVEGGKGLCWILPSDFINSCSGWCV
jgi:hypothetical protein